MTSPTTTFIDDLQKNAPIDIIDLRGSMQIGDEFKYVTAYISGGVPEFSNSIEILHITDVQFGHKHCNVDKFMEYRDWILSEPNRFVLFGGDMVDAETILTKGSPHENTGEPQDQVYRFAELAMPMRHRILGFVGGNHERHGVKTFGDLGHLIASLLRIPYSAGKQFIDVYYGNHHPYKISLWHGGGAARTKGAKAQMLHRFMGQAESDCYFVGHLHDVLMVGDTRERRNGKGSISLDKVFGVMSSSFLRYYGTYAEVMGLGANDTNMWRLVLEPNGKSELTLR